MLLFLSASRRRIFILKLMINISQYNENYLTKSMKSQSNNPVSVNFCYNARIVSKPYENRRQSQIQ